MDRATRSAVLAWVTSLLAGGATVVLATHDLEPFVMLASRAVRITGGVTELVDPLPEASANRLAVLEKLAR